MVDDPRKHSLQLAGKSQAAVWFLAVLSGGAAWEDWWPWSSLELSARRVDQVLMQTDVRVEPSAPCGCY